MKRIYIIGAGPGHPDCLTERAKNAVASSTVIITHGRLLANYTGSGKKFIESASAENIAALVQDAEDEDVISVIVSGDTGFYSLAKKLPGLLAEYGVVEMVSGISTISYFCAKIKKSWDDALLLSVHGRECNIADKVRRNKKVILLTDKDRTPAWAARQLCENGLENATFIVGENLSYEDERITVSSALETSEKQFAVLSVAMIENPAPEEHVFIGDSDFIRGDTPMTKQEIRCLSIYELRLAKGDIVYDVGAGTGSVAVEIALQMPEGRVFALERDEDAIKLIGENKRKFHANNLEIVSGDAEISLSALPAPDKVFIGGSGGRLKAILDAIYLKNPATRVVINAITLETLCEATDYYKNKKEYLFKVTQASVNSTKKAGEYHMLTAQNPVFIICAAGKEKAV